LAAYIRVTGVEQQGRSVGEEMNKFETMVFEAEKPYATRGGSARQATSPTS
jgi:hypothetical protein